MPQKYSTQEKWRAARIRVLNGCSNSNRDIETENTLETEILLLRKTPEEMVAFLSKKHAEANANG